MRALFVTTRLSGGAGIACRRIWESFREQDAVEVATLVYRENADLLAMQHNRTTGKTATIELYKHHSQWADEHLSKYLNEKRSSFSATYLSALDLQGPYDQFLINLFDEHDIVNLHWTSGLLTLSTLQYLDDAKKPTIITLHDQNYLTGACHYSAGCRLFTSLCSGCPQLANPRAQNIAERQNAMKHSVLSRSTYYWTGPSDWIIQEAARSGIPYSHKNLLPSLKNPCIDDAICTTSEVDEIRAKFHPQKKKVALVADDLNDPRKGILMGAKALAKAVSESKLLDEGIELHLVGAAEGSESAIRDVINHTFRLRSLMPAIDLVSHGRVPPHYMSWILQSVNLLVFPSIEENYSNLVVEALCAGTAVVALAVGGNREIARDYPELMTVVGEKMRIENGINGDDRTRLEYVFRLLSEAIRNKLFVFPSADLAQVVTERCKHAHSRAHVATGYLNEMKRIISQNRNNNAIDPTHDGYRVSSRLCQARHERKASMQHIVNTSEPVFWLGRRNDWPIELERGEVVFTLTLKPSWEASFISDQLDQEHLAWTELPIYSHDLFQIPELQYWDLVALVAQQNESGSHGLYNLLSSAAKTDDALPILVQAILPASSISQEALSTLADILWKCMCGEYIVPPMQGLSHYPHQRPFQQVVDIHTILRTRLITRERNPLSLIGNKPINTEEPVFWLGRNAYNDLSTSTDQCIAGVGLYPSWEAEFISKTFSREAEINILHEVLHTESAIPELRYWNTIFFSISASAGFHLFTEEADLVHAFPVLYMGISDRSASLMSTTSFDLLFASESPLIIIPPMAGYRLIC